MEASCLRSIVVRARKGMCMVARPQKSARDAACAHLNCVTHPKEDLSKKGAIHHSGRSVCKPDTLGCGKGTAREQAASVCCTLG